MRQKETLVQSREADVGSHAPAGVFAPLRPQAFSACFDALVFFERSVRERSEEYL